MLLLGYYRCYQIFIKFYYQIIIDVIIICSGSSLLLYIYLWLWKVAISKYLFLARIENLK